MGERLKRIRYRLANPTSSFLAKRKKHVGFETLLLQSDKMFGFLSRIEVITWSSDHYNKCLSLTYIYNKALLIKIWLGSKYKATRKAVTRLTQFQSDPKLTTEIERFVESRAGGMASFQVGLKVNLSQPCK
ncbi:unnamed protein product [Clavelina lepadiformis]|uniref:Uncharacterized protein n=1 Tax=Clavelina lepadiformis TaxID=159417 RepID=A0ABP0GHM7_CLALP